MEDTVSRLESMLSDNTIDIFFCNCPTKKSEYEYHPIYRDSVLFMTGVDHPIASAYPLATTADEGYPWISLKLFENERFSSAAAAAACARLRIKYSNLRTFRQST